MEGKLTTSRGLVEIARVHPSSYNPRKYHDPAAHEDLKKSLAEVGQLVPLLMRRSPHTPDAYEIVCGERRWRAAKDLGWQQIEGIYDSRLDGNQALANQAMAAENVDRAALNPFEETVAILTQFADQLTRLKGWPKTEDPITTAASIMRRYVRGSPTRKQAIATELKTTTTILNNAIVKVCGARDGLKPASFVNNRIPLLELPEDVLLVLKEGKVHYSNARNIARVPDPATRAALLELAPQHSVKEMQQLVSFHRKTVPVPAERKASRIDEAKRLLTEINQRIDELDHLDYNATTAVLASLKNVITRL